jgi:hypothetical protein
MDTFSGTIDQEGKLQINNFLWVQPNLMARAGEEIEIRINHPKKKRSDKQNRWYWGVAIRTIIERLKEQSGETYAPNDIHQYILDKVVGVRFKTKEVMGMTVTYIESKSTSAMSTKEFNMFKFELQVHFARKDIVIPDPNENNYTNDFKSKGVN